MTADRALSTHVEAVRKYLVALEDLEGFVPHYALGDLFQLVEDTRLAFEDAALEETIQQEEAEQEAP